MRRVFWLIAAALLLAGCAGEKGIVEKEGYQLDTRRQAQAAYPRIKVLVIHYTADDFDSSLATLTDKQVSSHYLVPAVPPRYNGKPRIWQLVPEQELAWHAGISAWRGATRLNDISIGIELENRGWQKSAGVKYFAPFEPAQIQALIPLAKDIIARSLSHQAGKRSGTCGYRTAAQRRSGAIISLAATGAAGDWCLAGCAAG